MNAGNASIDLQLTVEAEGWPDADDLQALCVTAVIAIRGHLMTETGLQFPPSGCELSLVFGDDAAMRAIRVTHTA